MHSNVEFGGGQTVSIVVFQSDGRGFESSHPWVSLWTWRSTVGRAPILEIGVRCCSTNKRTKCQKTIPSYSYVLQYRLDSGFAAACNYTNSKSGQSGLRNQERKTRQMSLFRMNSSSELLVKHYIYIYMSCEISLHMTSGCGGLFTAFGTIPILAVVSGPLIQPVQSDSSM